MNKIILRNIKKNIKIITDSWRGYNDLNEKKKFKHLKINHQRNFVEPENDEIHTQNIENRWKHSNNFFKSCGSNRKRNLRNFIK